MYIIPLTIAKIKIYILSPIPYQEVREKVNFDSYVSYEGHNISQAQASLEWKICDRLPVIPGNLIFDPGSVWKMYKHDLDYYAHITYHLSCGKEQSNSLLKLNSTYNKFELYEEKESFRKRTVLSIGAGELIFRVLVVNSGGLVLHASGIDDNGKGIVFVGHSGEGKSTQARLWNLEPGVKAINDDRMVVRVECDGPKCYGTPWGGSENIANNICSPLSALVLIEKAENNSLRQLPYSEAVSLIMARTLLPYWDEVEMKKAIDNIETILKLVPVYCLKCRPESEVISLVRSVL